ncbi:MAG TPA: penicillin-binding transpeptidase domain-containing protein [Bryobacteraceae bacterium]|nr:penicillin-binding transpeptidase domain-containing protein [Bryobacteraceae bacterium]
MDEREREPQDLDLTTARVRRFARFAFVWAAIVLVRLVQLQIVQHGKYERLADNQHEQVEKVELSRGSILDRNGQRLAMSLPVDSVFVNPMQIRDSGVASEILGKLLDLDARQLKSDIDAAAAAHRGFLWVKRRLEPEDAERLRDLHLDWIGFQRENQRYYPYDDLAAHVLGSISSDDRALEGVELKLNDELAARPGLVRVSMDVRGQRFAQENASAPPQRGEDIQLTIDSRIQYIAERELKRTILEHHCWTGSLVVMNPNTGEILALASYPTFDPNKPPQKGDDPRARFDNAFSGLFEPGSVFKVVTLSAALEATNLTPDSVIPCYNGAFKYYDRVIHDHEPYAALPMWGVLAHSSNIGAIQIGLKVGKDKLYEYVKRFGFGQKTGILLPGEMRGLIRRPEKWSKTSIASISMGHEVLVTTVQLARAASVIANGGYLVEPRLVMDRKTDPPQRVIRAETAFTMRRMMEGVVLKGTGRKAQLDGYSTAGKTGTAQIADLETHRYTHFYNASFMGFAPVSNPALVIVVTANGATGHDGYGAEVSAPVFKTVGEAALRYLGVPRDIPDSSPNPDNGNVDDNDVSAIADLGSVPLPLDSSDDSSDDGAESGDQRALFSGPPSGTLVGLRVPNFVGMTMRGVVQQAAAGGIPVLFAGHGVARVQAPVAGAVLAAGEKVRVEFTN